MALVGLIYLQNAMLHLVLPVGFAYGELTERLVWLSKQTHFTLVSLRGEVLTNVLNPRDRGVLGCDTAGRAREKETVLSHVLRVLPAAVAKPA